MTKEINKEKGYFNGKTETDGDFFISTNDTVDITLTEQESMKLLEQLEIGPNDNALEFAKKARGLYRENKIKVQSYLKKNLH